MGDEPREAGARDGTCDSRVVEFLGGIELVTPRIAGRVIVANEGGVALDRADDVAGL